MPALASTHACSPREPAIAISARSSEGTRRAFSQSRPTRRTRSASMDSPGSASAPSPSSERALSSSRPTSSSQNISWRTLASVANWFDRASPPAGGIIVRSSHASRAAARLRSPISASRARRSAIGVPINRRRSSGGLGRRSLCGHPRQALEPALVEAQHQRPHQRLQPALSRVRAGSPRCGRRCRPRAGSAPRRGGRWLPAPSPTRRGARSRARTRRSPTARSPRR